MDNREKVLFDNGIHKCVMFSLEDESHEDSFLSVNQYLIVQNGEGILIDPGNEAIFDELYDAVSKYVDIENIKYIFFSHQDPDVAGSIAQWNISTKAKFILSSLWIRFMSHYGFMDIDRIISLDDAGAKIKFGTDYLQFIPAHFLHSPGNFSLYDANSKILFSGDIGTAILKMPVHYKRVEDFEKHKEYLHDFHKRYMGSNKVCRSWVSHINKLEVAKIAPQHGFVFEDENVELFLEWFNELKCGSDFIEELY